jgi:hypothetical protein
MAEVKKAARREGGKPLPPFLAIGLRVDPFLLVDQFILGKTGIARSPTSHKAGSFGASAV